MVDSVTLLPLGSNGMTFSLLKSEDMEFSTTFLLPLPDQEFLQISCSAECAVVRHRGLKRKPFCSYSSNVGIESVVDIRAWNR
jgi:hypothetical protein